MAQIRELHSTSLAEPAVIHHPDMVYVPAGFWMDVTPVTNADFARFVVATGYVTVAERLLEHKTDANAAATFDVGGGMVYRSSADNGHGAKVRGTWTYEAEACWRAPEGAGSSIVGRYSHPVVHIAYEDALGYATWAGKDLPSEAEWEFAARSGVDDDTAITAESQRHAPAHATLPVRSSKANDYGLYEMFGNVWQWTIDAPPESRVTELQIGCSPPDTRPKGNETAFGRVPRYQPRKILKGGSYLCGAGCGCLRPTARHVQPVDIVACHVGFRCVLRSHVVAPRRGLVS